MKKRNENWNIPNLLSGMRIVLVAPFLVCYLTNHTIWAWVILGVSGVTDFLDGKLARRLNQITDLGKILDPAADKVTQGAVAVGLAVKQPLLLPLLGIFLFKEFLMLIAGIILVANRKRPCAAKWYGKIATASFYVSFVTVVALKAIWHYESFSLTCILLSITAGFMIYAFLRYFGVFVHLLRSKDPKDYLQIKLRQPRQTAKPEHAFPKPLLPRILQKNRRQQRLKKEP